MHPYPKSIIEARKAFLTLTLEQEKEIIAIYKRASIEIKERLLKSKRGTLEERYLKEMAKAIDAYRKELYINLSNRIRADIELGAEIGARQTKEFLENVAVNAKLKQSFVKMFANINDDVVRLMVSGGFYKDKRTLSSRIWSLTEKNVKDIDRIINIAVAEQKSVNQLATQLVPYLNGEGTPQKTLLRGINRHLPYEAVRVGRTSMAHAANEASVQAAMNNPFSKGLKWNLSASHATRLGRFGKSRDICDEYAEQNSYDLGRGVYPPASYPVSHPNCLCYSTEVDVPVEEARKEIISWINGADNKKLDNWAKRNGFDI